MQKKDDSKPANPLPFCTLCFTKALVMNDFSLTQETDRIDDIGIVAETKDIVIGSAGLLFCCNHTSTTFPLKIPVNLNLALFCLRVTHTDINTVN